MATIKKSFLWQISQQIIRGGIALLVTVFIGRTVGTSGLGMLDSSIALVTLAGGLATLGMSRIVTAELCREGDHTLLKGTSLTLTGLACGLGFVVINALAWNANPTERLTTLFVSLVLLSQPVAYLSGSVFEAIGRFDMVGKVLFIGLLISTVIRIFLIMAKAPLPWFALAYSIDMIATCLAGWAYLKFRAGHQISFLYDGEVARMLLRKSLPLLLAGMAAYLYGTFNVILIKWISGNEQVGVFGAASRISQIPIIIPGALLGSFTAKLMEYYNRHADFSERDLRKLVQLLCALGLATLMGGWVLGPMAIKILFGDAFAASGVILRIHVIGVFFLIIGSLRNHLLVLEGRGKLILLADILGALLNICLSFWLIPIHGALGASWATVISYFVSFFLINFFHPDLRKYNRMLLLVLKRKSSIMHL